LAFHPASCVMIVKAQKGFGMRHQSENLSGFVGQSGYGKGGAVWVLRIGLCNISVCMGILKGDLVVIDDVLPDFLVLKNQFPFTVSHGQRD